MRAWYVVKTKPRQEEQTSVVLRHRGLEIYLPKIRPCTYKTCNASAKRLEPLFPGYLFACLDIKSTDWLSARAAPGVAYFLGSEGSPSPVPDELVEGVRRRAEDQLKNGWPNRFRAGDRVVISGGPLAGLEAIFDGVLSPSGRSRVFLELLSRIVPVVVPASLLRRAV